MLDPLTALRERLAKSSYRKLAKELGFSPSYLHEVDKELRPASDLLANALGLERVVTYRRTKR